jgi:hypothetical protein
MGKPMGFHATTNDDGDDGEHDCERSAFPDGVSVPAVPVL